MGTVSSFHWADFVLSEGTGFPRNERQAVFIGGTRDQDAGLKFN